MPSPGNSRRDSHRAPGNHANQNIFLGLILVLHRRYRSLGRRLRRGNLLGGTRRWFGRRSSCGCCPRHRSWHFSDLQFSRRQNINRLSRLQNAPGSAFQRNQPHAAFQARHCIRPVRMSHDLRSRLLRFDYRRHHIIPHSQRNICRAIKRIHHHRSRLQFRGIPRVRRKNHLAVRKKLERPFPAYRKRRRPHVIRLQRVARKNSQVRRRRHTIYSYRPNGSDRTQRLILRLPRSSRRTRHQWQSAQQSRRQQRHSDRRIHRWPQSFITFQFHNHLDVAPATQIVYQLSCRPLQSASVSFKSSLLTPLHSARRTLLRYCFYCVQRQSHQDHALPMKILHIVKTVTGATWVYHQVRVLCSLGFEIVVALPSATAGLAPKYQEAGATVIPINLDVPSKHPWQIPAVLKSCRTLVKNVRPDIIHTHHVGTTLVVRAALGKSYPIPPIFQVPGPLHLEHSFFAHLDTALAGTQDHWIASCRWTERRYQQLGVSPKRLSLSYLGTDLNSFTTTRTNILRRELGLAPDTPLVGMVCYMYAPKRFLGQTVGLKGHEDFIAALQLAKKECPNLHAVIIGGAWNGAIKYETHLRELGRKACNGSLAFLGTRSDIPAIYPDIDLAVVASHTENVPHSAIEALLSRVPVVSTNV